MINYVVEYRINKKGSEYFRSSDYKVAFEKLQELKRKKPRVDFSLQERSCRLDSRGIKVRDYLGRPAWGPWRQLDNCAF